MFTINEIKRVHERIGKEIEQLNRLEETVRHLKENADTEASSLKKDVLKRIHSHIEALKKLQQFTEEAIKEYQDADQRILDAINNEIIIYPPVKIGISRFEELEKYQNLMPFKH